MPVSATAPDFEQAERLFLDFVHQNGGSGDLIWVFREDLNLASQHEVLILQPDRVRNRSLVERAYEVSVSGAFGILLDVLCPITEGGFCAYFEAPKDRDEAERKIINGLTFGVLGFGFNRVGRISGRPKILGSLSRWLGPERHDALLCNVPSRRFWEQELQ